MPEDHLRFRCYRCNQLLGSSSKRAGAVITCPRCGAELKVPRAEEQAVAAEATRSGQGFAAESRVPVGSNPPAVKSSGTAMPSFMSEIAAAIPDDLATLRPEDIRVEAEFADLVITTHEGLTSPAPAAEESRKERYPGDPVELEAYFAQSSPPAEPSSIVTDDPPSVFQAQPVPIVPAQPAPLVVTQPAPIAPAQPAPVVPAQPRSVEPPVDAAIGAVLPAINIEQPSLLPRGREYQAVSEVILQPATVLAWSLLVLLALPMAFLAGLLMGHFVWR